MPGKNRIMLVDDDPEVCLLLSKVLVGDGFEVYCTDDGEDVMRNIEDEGFALILLDLKLPKMGGIMGGIDILKRIREMGKDMLVIVISGYLTDKYIDEIVELGVYDYFKKPFNLKELRHTIKRALA